MRRPKTKTMCLECGQPFFTFQCWLDRGESRFCSRTCSGAYKKKFFRHSKEARARITNSLLGRKHSKETKLKMSRAQKGKQVSIESRLRMSVAKIGLYTGNKHPNWKGGITPIHLKIRNSPEYANWRDAVFERDNYCCVICGKSDSGRLNADHIKPFALYPELRLEVTNGRTLCISCHHKTETWGGRTSKLKREIAL